MREDLFAIIVGFGLKQVRPQLTPHLLPGGDVGERQRSDAQQSDNAKVGAALYNVFETAYPVIETNKTVLYSRKPKAEVAEFSFQLAQLGLQLTEFPSQIAKIGTQAVELSLNTSKTGYRSFFKVNEKVPNLSNGKDVRFVCHGSNITAIRHGVKR